MEKASRDSSIPGSEVARRMNVDRFGISRPVQREGHDKGSVEAEGMI
jgi:hypothetical protein